MDHQRSEQVSRLEKLPHEWHGVFRYQQTPVPAFRLRHGPYLHVYTLRHSENVSSPQSTELVHRHQSFRKGLKALYAPIHTVGYQVSAVPGLLGIHGSFPTPRRFPHPQFYRKPTHLASLSTSQRFQWKQVCVLTSWRADWLLQQVHHCRDGGRPGAQEIQKNLGHRKLLIQHPPQPRLPFLHQRPDRDPKRV